MQLPEGRREPRLLYVFDREGHVHGARPLVEGGSVSLQVPASTLSAALLLYETQPEHYVDVWQESTEGDVDSDTIALNAVNFGPDPLQVKLTTRGEAPLDEAAGQMEFSVPAGGTSQVRFSLGELPDLVLPARLGIEAEWEGGRMNTWAEIRPLLLNPALDLDEDRDRGPDFWEPGGTTSVFPRGIEDGVVWMDGQEKEYQYFIQHVPLKPNTKYYFAGRVKRSAQTEAVSIAVVEFVGERGLRMHQVGNDEALPANEWQRFETTFTTGEVFRDSAVYLYNIRSTVRAWYDDMELREVVE